MRAVIYARYSSENQREASIEDQVRVCRRFIASKDWTYLTAYRDQAMSGASSLRPGYQQLLADTLKSSFEIVVAEALDRLSRDQADIAVLYKQLNFRRIKLITLAEGEISELHVGLKGTMNALYLKDLAEKTRRGLEGRVRQGRSGGGLCYGYRVLTEIGAQGELRPGKREIVPAEAPNVVRIFQDYAQGHSSKSIAHTLNREGVPGPQGKAWGPSTIHGNRARGTGILNNELYIGRLVWNRLTYRKDPETGKRISRLNPESDWVIHDVPELRIVSGELWHSVRVRQSSLRASRQAGSGVAGFWDRRRPRFLLSGLIKCGVCGGGYSKISASLFGCSTHRNKGTCSNRLNIRQDVLETAVLGALKTHLMRPELVEEFSRAFIEEINQVRKTGNLQRERLNCERTANDRRLRSLVTAVAEGSPPKALLEEMRRLETRQEEIERELAVAPETAKPLIHPNMAALYRRKVSEIEMLLADSTSKDEAIQTIRSLIDRIVLTPVAGELQIDLKGELAAILSLCQDSKKPAARVRDGLEQLKLVAGAGFEPATFRL
ncbi:MAG: recombinase family protein [Dongiaceae bacterium]